MSAITAKASRKMKKYAVLTREPRCFLGSFVFSWEQRKAIDIADYSKGNGYSKGDLTDAGTPIILYGRLYTKYQFAISEVDTFAVPRNGAVYSQGNEVIVPASGETAEDIARASAVEKSGVLLGGDLNILRPFDFINPLFLALAISNGEPQKELAKKAQGKSVVHIHNTDIQEVTIAYPSRTEQDRIVSVFRQLDNLITLHQRKCALLFSPFQSFISMMFTTSTFSWEQRKLGELVDVCSGRDYKHLSEGTIPVYGTGGYMLSVNDALSYDRDAIGIGRKGTIDRPYILKAPFWTVDTLFYAIPREKVDLNYAFDIFQNIDWKKKDESTGVPSLSKTAINDIDVLAPKHDEQQIIGQFFAAIDNLITLHQRKCIFFTGRAGRLISTVNKKRITSSWEQRKFSELVQIERGGSPRPIDDFITDAPNGLNWVKIGDAPTQGNYITKTAEKIRPEGLSKTREVHPGDLILSNSMSFGKPYIMGIDGCIHDGWLLIRNTYGVFDLTFLCHLLGTPQMLSQYRSLAAGSTVNNLNKELVGNTYVTIPSITEQRVLGAYLEQLDNLITLHQRKPFLMKWRTSDANRNQTNRLVL